MHFINHNSVNDPSPLYPYFDGLIKTAEVVVGYGIYDKGFEITIYFVDEETIDERRNAINAKQEKEAERRNQQLRKFMEELREREDEKRQKLYREIENLYHHPSLEGIDLLGLYLHDGEIDDSGDPEVWICYDKIVDRYESQGISDIITAQVIVHELAHAIMDRKRYSSGNKKFYEWMEEPMANKIALAYMKAAEDSGAYPAAYQDSRNFMNKQPSNYKFGVTLYDLRKDCNFDWEEWADAKDFQHQKVEDQLHWIKSAMYGTSTTPIEYQELFDKIVDPDVRSSVVWDSNGLSIGNPFFSSSPFAGMNPNDNQIFYTLRRCRKEREHLMRHFPELFHYHYPHQMNHLVGAYGVFVFDAPITRLDGPFFDEFFHFPPFCDELEAIALPNSVNSFSLSMSDGFENLKAFYGKFASADHRCLIIDGELVAFAPAGLTEYEIPEGVTAIGDFAFENADELREVTIPDGVKTIGRDAFGFLPNLTKITIPNSVTSIDHHAFVRCKKLGTITIPRNTIIDVGAFEDCDNVNIIRY